MTMDMLYEFLEIWEAVDPKSKIIILFFVFFVIPFSIGSAYHVLAENGYLPVRVSYWKLKDSRLINRQLSAVNLIMALAFSEFSRRVFSRRISLFGSGTVPTSPTSFTDPPVCFVLPIGVVECSQSTICCRLCARQLRVDDRCSSS